MKKIFLASVAAFLAVATVNAEILTWSAAFDEGEDSLDIDDYSTATLYAVTEGGTAVAISTASNNGDGYGFWPVSEVLGDYANDDYSFYVQLTGDDVASYTGATESYASLVDGGYITDSAYQPIHAVGNTWNSVPEPCSTALIAMGVAALLSRRRKVCVR